MAAPAPGQGAQLYSGLQGRALTNIPPSQYPTMAEALSVIPKHCFEKDTVKSIGYAILSTVMTVGLGVLAYLYIPLQARSRPTPGPPSRLASDSNAAALTCQMWGALPVPGHRVPVTQPGQARGGNAQLRAPLSSFDIFMRPNPVKSEPVSPALL